MQIGVSIGTIPIGIYGVANWQYIRIYKGFRSVPSYARSNWNPSPSQVFVFGPTFRKCWSSRFHWVAFEKAWRFCLGTTQLAHSGLRARAGPRARDIATSRDLENKFEHRYHMHNFKHSYNPLVITNQYATQSVSSVVYTYAPIALVYALKTSITWSMENATSYNEY